MLRISEKIYCRHYYIMIYINELLSSNDIFHIEGLSDPISALKIMYCDKHQCVSFEQQLDFCVADLGTLKVDDKTKKLIYTYDFTRSCDIYTNFESDVPIKIKIGPRAVEAKDFVLVEFSCTWYQNSVIFYLDPDVKTFYLKFKQYLLNNSDRHKLGSKGCYTDSHQYTDGFAININGLDDPYAKI